MASEKKKYQLTEQGKKQFEERLDYLKNVLRPQNIAALKDARSQGDLSENADYSAAREEQGKIEGEILYIEDILQHCVIISSKDNSDVVNLGKKVKLTIDGREREYSLVSTIEVNPREGKISNESPLGQAIIGHIPGDTVVFRTESDREVHVEILEVTSL